MRKAGRFAWRSLWLGAELFLCGLRFLFLYVRTAGSPSMVARAECLHRCARGVLRVFASDVTVQGPRPQAGLLVSNHLSYLDILVLGSLSPAVFVSKAEVKHWPVFGWFGALAGTVFVRRERRGEVGAVAGRIHTLLQNGQLVILFPEGTSSDGREILPFKSSLLEPVAGESCPVHAGCLRYALADGVVARDVCYWGDMSFVPHFLKLLTKQRVQASASFITIQAPATDRKALAKQLHSEVVRLKIGVPASDAFVGLAQ